MLPPPPCSKPQRSEAEARALREYEAAWRADAPGRPAAHVLGRYYMWAQTECHVHLAVYDPLGEG